EILLRCRAGAQADGVAAVAVSSDDDGSLFFTPLLRDARGAQPTSSGRDPRLPTRLVYTPHARMLNMPDRRQPPGSPPTASPATRRVRLCGPNPYGSLNVCSVLAARCP